MSKEWFEEEEKGEKRESDFHTWEEGDTKIRILTSFTRVLQASQGSGNAFKPLGMVEEGYQPPEGVKVTEQGWCWGILRSTGKLKIFKLGRSLLGHLTKLKNSEDYQYDDYPMPYDLTIHNAGDKGGAARYSITASRRNSEVTQEEMDELAKKKPIPEIVEAIKSKKEEKPTARYEHETDEDSENAGGGVF